MISKKIISSILVLTFANLVCVIPAFADEPPPAFEAISPMTKGDKAPFEGILFSKDLAARIEAEKKTKIDSKICESKSKAAVEIVRSELNRQLEISNGRYEAFEEKHNSLMEIKDNEIDFFRKSYQPPPWYKEPAFLLSMGIIAGVGLSIGAAYVVKLVK